MGIRSLRPRRTAELARGLQDFSGAIIGNVSNAGLVPRHVAKANNATFDSSPRAVGVRRGYRDIAAGVLPFAPHSVMLHYGESATTVFAGCENKVYKISIGGGVAEQTLPVSPTTGWWSWLNINGALVMCQIDGTNPPIAWNGTEWLSTVLPTPGAPTLTDQNADAGSAVDAGDHLYRFRWRFKNGSSVAGPSLLVAATGPGFRVNLAVPTQPTRSDYLGWSLERTKLSAPTLWWWVKDGTGAGAIDLVSDASLGDLIGAEPGVHAGPPTDDGGKYFRGMVAHKGRIFGWMGSRLYVGQSIDDSAEASGPYNFKADRYLIVGEDDADAIVACERSGDSLFIAKRASCKRLDGFDLASFGMVDVDDYIGAAGPRCVASHGSTVYLYAGGGRIFRIRDRDPVQIGKDQVGHYLSQIPGGVDGNVVVRNRAGESIVVSYQTAVGENHSDLLELVLRSGQWQHHTEISATDIVSPRRRDHFDGATMLWADKNLTPPSSDQLQALALNPSFLLFSDDGQQYAASLDSYGANRWTPGGLPLPPVSFTGISSPRASVCHDANGGIFVAQIEDVTNDRVLLTRLAPDGSVIAGFPKVVESGASQPVDDVVVQPDGSGGCFVVWNRRGSPHNQYASRYNNSGTLLWGPVVVTTVTDIFYESMAITGLSGDLVCVTSGSAFPTGKWTRIDAASGAVVWGPFDKALHRPNHEGELVLNANGDIWYKEPGVHGNRICLVSYDDGSTLVPTGGSHLLAPGTGSGLTVQVGTMCGDGALGAIVTYAGYLSGGSGTSYIYAQRVSELGAYLWPGRALLHTPETGEYCNSLFSVPDGAGGAIVAFATRLLVSASNYRTRLWVTRVSADGVLVWGDKKLIHERTDTLSTGRFTRDIVGCSDGANGAIFAWQDVRNSTSSFGSYAQPYMARVLADGSLPWTDGGVQVSSARDNVSLRGLLFTDSPVADLPVSAVPGYHVWAGLDGFKDRRSYQGIGGDPIPWYIETPDMDEGVPDVVKDFGRLELEVLVGSGTITGTIGLDSGQGAAATISNEFSGAKWGRTADGIKPDTLIWNQGKWARVRTGELIAPLPPGTIGKRWRASFSSELDGDFLLKSIVADYVQLPDRPVG